MSDDFERTHARRTDPETSKKAAREVAVTAGSHKDKLLQVYAAHPNLPMNYSQAHALTDIHPLANTWHRVGDLRDGEYVETVDINGVTLTAKGNRGKDQLCYVITEKGLRKAKELREQ